MLLQFILAVVVLLLGYCYYRGKYAEWYWKNRGADFHPKNKVWGPFYDFVFGDRAFFEIIGDLYKQYPSSPAIGVGSMTLPTLVVRDATNIKHIVQVDFEAFYHRGIEQQPGDLLADSIPFMNGKRWKLMRQNMTPLFSAAKLKSMYYVMDKSAQDFVTYLNMYPEKLKGDAFNTLSTFCSAAIAASVFGITSKSVFDSPFLSMAQNALKPTFWTNLRFSILVNSPWLFRKLKLALFREHEEFFIGAVKQLIRRREQERGKQFDFGNICVDLQKKGELKDNDTGITIKPSDEILAAQAFFFFIAGVEPSATAIFFTLVELGLRPDILQRLQKDIDEGFEKHNGQMTYESLSELTYLDMVIYESLRKHPPIGILVRQSVKDSVLPVGNIKVDKNTRIFMSLFELHRDPKLYPEPDKFIPERFARSSKEVKDYTYLPFGRGNRNCIGERFAHIQVATGLMHLLRHFSVKTHIDGDEIKYKKEQVQVKPMNVDVEFIPRNLQKK